MEMEGHRFFSCWPDDEKEALVSASELVTLGDGEVIFEEGDPSDSLYLILEGQVALWKKGMDDAMRKITAFVENESFGELGVLDGGARSARAVSFGNVKLCKVPRDTLVEVIKRCPGEAIMDLCIQIIERLRITNELFVTEAVRKERMTMIGEMANTIIHDFKNPFAVMQLACDGIASQHQDELTKQYCELIEEQVKRVTNMAQDILDFSRTTTRLDKLPWRVADVLERFEKLNMAYLERNKVELDLEPTELIVDMDPDKILRIVQNIVNNAVEAIRGQGEGRIRITTGQEDHTATIAIEDNGPGIPREIQPILFDPFVTRGKAGGSGLGMAIAQAFAQAHGGELTFESRDGLGTTFFLRLPYGDKN